MSVFSEKQAIADHSGADERKAQLWKINDALAQKNGPHATIYWVKQQKKFEDGSFKGEKWRTSSKYTGAWKDNQKAGFGIQVFENGDKYEGGWLAGKREGQGTLWVLDEKKNLRRRYTGDWVNDKKEGRGTMFYDNEDRYDGFWSQNRPCGEGRMIYKNGDVYVGSWDVGKRSGYGVLTKRNGDHFEGNWVNDKREGQGSYFYAQKNKLFVGEYVEDMPKVGIYTEVKEPDTSEEPGKDEKLREFDDIPPIPSLGLRDPIGVLERAFKKTRQKRILYRAKFMSLDQMFNLSELEQMRDIFKMELPQKDSDSIFLEQLPGMLEAMGIEIEFEMIPGLLAKILDEEVGKMIDFDSFVRLVAVILEENNKLYDTTMEAFSEDEFEVAS